MQSERWDEGALSIGARGAVTIEILNLSLSNKKVENIPLQFNVLEFIIFKCYHQTLFIRVRGIQGPRKFEWVST